MQYPHSLMLQALYPLTYIMAPGLLHAPSPTSSLHRVSSCTMPSVTSFPLNTCILDGVIRIICTHNGSPERNLLFNVDNG